MNAGMLDERVLVTIENFLALYMVVNAMRLLWENSKSVICLSTSNLSMLSKSRHPLQNNSGHVPEHNN